MNSFLQLPVVRTLHARGLLFVAVLLPIVAAVLVGGALEADPEPSSRRVVPDPVERPVGLLPARPDLEKTPLTYQSDYWQQLGARAVQHIVLLGPRRVPGIVLEEGLVITSTAAVDPTGTRRPARTDGSGGSGRSGGWGGSATDADPMNAGPVAAGPVNDDSADDDPANEGSLDDAPAGGTGGGDDLGPGLQAVDWDLGLALYRLGDIATAPPFELGDGTSLHPGAFAAGVTRTVGGRMQIAPGHVAALPSGDGSPAGDAFQVTLDVPPSAPVAALVDLDGRLIGGAFRHESGLQLHSASELLDMAARLGRNPVCYAIVTTNISEEVHELLDVEGGVAVARVRAAAFRPEPSIRPGDVLLEWGDEPVASVDQFQEIYRTHEPGDLVSYVALRGTRRVRGNTVLPDRHCRPVGDGSTEVDAIGLAMRWIPAADVVAASRTGASDDDGVWEVTGVSADGPAAAAGVMAGDRIHSVNGRAVPERNAVRTIDRLWQRERALVLTLSRDDTVRLIAVSAGEPTSTP